MVRLLLYCCPVTPHRAPRTLRQKARPCQRNGLLHLYNVIGKKGPLDLWKLYKVYRVLAGLKELGSAGSRWGFRNGDSRERMADLCIQTPDRIPKSKMCQRPAKLARREPLWGAFWGDLI